MKQLLIFGLSGQVGDALLPQLLQSEYQITAISRQQKKSQKNIIWQQAAFPDFAIVQSHYDAIISLGPLDLFSVWLSASNISIGKIIALSSTSIVTKKNSPDPDEQKLAQVLFESEQRLMEHANKTSANLFILRPTLIYGAGRDQSLSRWLRLASRFKFVVLPKKAAGLRQPVHVADLADAVFNAVISEKSIRLILDLPGGETLSFDQMLIRSLRANLPMTKVLRIPDFLFRLLLRFAEFVGLGSGLGAGFFARLGEDWVFDAAPARNLLGYEPRPFSP
jgi:nucleoside-diphosphate-sugar epimerase